MEGGAGSDNLTYLPLDRLLDRKAATIAGGTSAGNPAAVSDPDVYTAPVDSVTRSRADDRLRGAR
jgi:hypothetical protein